MLARLDDYLDYHGRVHADVIFVEQAERQFTFSSARLRIDAIAAGLAAEGLQKDDRLALLGKNSIDFFFLYLACARLGVVPVGINYRLTPSEIAFIVADAGAQMLFADAEMIAEATTACAPIKAVCLYGECEGFVEFEQWLAQAPEFAGRESLRASDIMSQMYTSGTTGLPKGVLLTHDNIISNVHQTSMASEYTFSAGDEFLLVAPMYHAAGIMIGYTGLMQGLTLIIHREYDSTRVARTLAARPIAAVTLVPAMLQMIVDTVPGLDQLEFPSLRLIYYGASPISVPLLRRAIDIFACDFTQGYGQTETNSIVAMLSASDHRRALDARPELLEACGRAAFNTELKVVDADGVALPPGQSGEIVARGPQIMQGYWNKPDETAQVLREGWLHTGDMGCFDDEGYLRIVGRLKDMIVSGAENIYPVEIENVLTAHPEISDAAVIGVSHRKWGEVPLAIIVTEQAEGPDATKLGDHCRESLARFKVPAYFHYTDNIPRNPSGKILKQQLREAIGKDYDE